MDENLREQCRQGVRRTLAENAWKLIQDEDAFLAEVLAEVQTRSSKTNKALEKVIKDATVNRYNHLWHAACADGHPLQTRALDEVHTYLYRIAHFRIKDDETAARECAQTALTQIWQHLGQVEDPGAFLQWITVVAIREVGKKLKEGREKVIDPKTGEISWEDREITQADLVHETQDDDDGVEYARMDTSLSREEPEVMPDDLRERLEAEIRRCLRSEKRQEVIIRLLLEQKDYSVVSAELGITLDTLYVLKSKAMKTLRNCEEMRDLFEDVL